jgi:flagellar basal-body rod modification protein FlgD
MVDSTKSLSSTSSAQSAYESALSSTKNEQVSKDQFLQLLVTQLKNQDPLDPMKSEEFAVNLAQFSQLEQLVAINEKMGEQGTDLSSLAAYLGHEVVVSGNTVHTEGGQGAHLRVDLPTDVESMEVQLIDDQGHVADVVRFDSVSQGAHTLDLGQTAAGTGDYTFKVTATTTNGTYAVDAKASGTVTGVIPGADPKLIINGKETTPGSVVEIGLPPTA